MAQLTELGCLKKLITQTYDGAAVMSGELNGVQAKVKDSAPDAIFIHCLAHKLNLVLIQAALHIQNAIYFFQPLEDYCHSLHHRQKELQCWMIW